MSFRNRLTVFFIVLVILPMVVVAAVGFALASDSEEGKTDARLGQARTTAEALYHQYQDRAQAAARTIGQEPALAGAIQDGKRPALQRRLAALAREAGAVRVTMSLPRAGDFQMGSGEAVAYARTRLIDRQGRSAGLLTVSVTGAEALGSELRRLTRTDVVIRGPSGPLFSTFGDDTGRAPLPDEGDVQVGGRTLRVAMVDAPASGGGRIAVRVLAERAGGGLG